MSSSTGGRRRAGSRRPSHVLLKVEAVVGVHQNRTTAVSVNRKGAPIEVSFLLKPPPQPSIVYVDSEDVNPFFSPLILCSVDDLLLLRVNIGSKNYHMSLEHHNDYYVYRAAAAAPALHRLESPPDPVFRGEDVGLLPRPDGRFTVAALMYIGRNDVYELQVYDSVTRTWTTRKVSVEPPQWDPLPERIPMYCDVLLRHHTSAVITIGGEGGTMAWVDLWRSILICDVLLPNPSLRGVPVPLPLTQMSLNDGLGVDLDFAGHSRGISFNRDKGCLMLVHVERNESPPLHVAIRGLHGQEKIKVLDWEVTTWSNTKLSDSLEDWHQERSVQASNITVKADVIERARLPCRPRNLSICQPTLSPNGEDDVVYLVARENYLHPNAWFLAVDMKNQGTLKHVAPIGIQAHSLYHRICSLSRISKYTNPKKRLNSSATDLGN
ncbi:hypothetical protein HU200_030652 [Digitaria exilis]|uniref:DUF1618 domain-containing protein n=1 Tax=Digitaria exilis TaxID=1010633 RepID=A0A835BQZ9_9POAL|nr:hypothetical protein HU200_030652 [Digitaria exilis]